MFQISAKECILSIITIIEYWYLCVYICVCVCVFMWVCVCVFMCVCVCMCFHMYVCVHVCVVCVCLCVLLCVCVCVCVCLCVCVGCACCVFVCIHVCVTFQILHWSLSNQGKVNQMPLNVFSINWNMNSPKTHVIINIQISCPCHVVRDMCRPISREEWQKSGWKRIVLFNVGILMVCPCIFPTLQTALLCLFFYFFRYVRVSK